MFPKSFAKVISKDDTDYKYSNLISFKIKIEDGWLPYIFLLRNVYNVTGCRNIIFMHITIILTSAMTLSQKVLWSCSVSKVNY